MMRDHAQLNECCRRLLASVHKEDLWGDDGPTDEGWELHKANGGYLSSGERIFLLIAIDVWNGQGGARFGDVINRLDNDRLKLVADFMLALRGGSLAIDAWLAGKERAR